MARKQRNDKGKRHTASTHGGKVVQQCNLAGVIEREYDSLMDAVDYNDVNATYQGILYCCEGNIRKHRGKVWRWKREENSTEDLSDLI